MDRRGWMHVRSVSSGQFGLGPAGSVFVCNGLPVGIPYSLIVSTAWLPRPDPIPSAAWNGHASASSVKSRPSATCAPVPCTSASLSAASRAAAVTKAIPAAGPYYLLQVHRDGKQRTTRSVPLRCLAATQAQVAECRRLCRLVAEPIKISVRLCDARRLGRAHEVPDCRKKGTIQESCETPAFCAWRA